MNSSLAANNYIEVARIENQLTVRDSIENGIQLRKLAETNWEMMMKLLIRLIKNTSVFYNVNNNITDAQLVMIAQSLIDSYGYDNIEDVIMAMKTGRSGRYGKLFGRFDGEVILSWMQQYLEEKAEQMEKIHHNRKFEPVEYDHRVSETIKGIAESRQVKPETPKVEVTHEAWKKWFDESIDQMTLQQLHDMRKDMFHNSVFQRYKNEIERIDIRIKELSE